MVKIFIIIRICGQAREEKTSDPRGTVAVAYPEIFFFLRGLINYISHYKKIYNNYKTSF